MTDMHRQIPSDPTIKGGPPGVDVAPKSLVRGFLYILFTVLGLVSASLGLIVLNIKIDGVYDSFTVSLLRNMFVVGVLVAYISYRLHMKGRKAIGVSVALIASGVAFFFVSWFVHPVQSRSRYLDHMIECRVDFEMAPPLALIWGMQNGEFSESDSLLIMESFAERARTSLVSYEQHVLRYGDDLTWSTSIWKSIVIAFPGLILIIVACSLMSGWEPAWRRRRWNK